MASVDYGSDISIVADIDLSGRVVTGPRLVAEAVARRLMTPNGGLIGDVHYGFDLSQYINDDMGPADFAAMISGAVQECLKDERVLAAEVTVETTTLDASRTQKSLDVSITLTISSGTFDLVLAVSDVGVELLSVE